MNKLNNIILVRIARIKSEKYLSKMKYQIMNIRNEIHDMKIYFKKLYKIQYKVTNYNK